MTTTPAAAPWATPLTPETDAAARAAGAYRLPDPDPAYESPRFDRCGCRRSDCGQCMRSLGTSTSGFGAWPNRRR